MHAAGAGQPVQAEHEHRGGQHRAGERRHGGGQHAHAPRSRGPARPTLPHPRQHAEPQRRAGSTHDEEAPGQDRRVAQTLRPRWTPTEPRSSRDCAPIPGQRNARASLSVAQQRRSGRSRCSQQPLPAAAPRWRRAPRARDRDIPRQQLEQQEQQQRRRQHGRQPGSPGGAARHGAVSRVSSPGLRRPPRTARRRCTATDACGSPVTRLS